MRKTVEYGRYFTKNNELREIEWIILDETPDGKKLLISKDCIEAMQYEYLENENNDPKWENCVIRHWLNDYFINSFFTASEKKKMCPVSVVLAGLTPQEDKIVLLSAEEVEKYLPNESDRKAKPTMWAKRSQDGERLYTEKGYCTWLLRDPSKRFAGNWTGVSSNGILDLDGGDFYFSGQKGIRPVILVDMS